MRFVLGFVCCLLFIQHWLLFVDGCVVVCCLLFVVRCCVLLFIVCVVAFVLCYR